MEVQVLALHLPRKLLVTQVLGNCTITKADTRELLEYVDRDGSQKLEFPEFLELMTAQLGVGAHGKTSFDVTSLNIKLMATAFRFAANFKSQSVEPDISLAVTCGLCPLLVSGERSSSLQLSKTWMDVVPNS